MLKITDLVDSKNFIVLHDSEIKNIQGGLCLEPFFRGYKFHPVGTIKEFYFGLTYKCVEIPGSGGLSEWVSV